MNTTRPAVEAIHIAGERGAPMRAVESVLAVAGHGLEGDRKYRADQPVSPKSQVTLIEAEAIEALAAEHGVQLDPGESRRNITTRGVSLNDLVGREFRVGGARLRGLELCEPCDYLQKLTGKTLLPGLVHRAGLRAQILEGGTVRRLDPIETGGD